LLTEAKKRQDATQAMFDAGEVDAMSVANARVEFSAAALARVTLLVKAQQSLAGLEDAVQSPLTLNVTAPAWERNPRAANEPTKK